MVEPTSYLTALILGLFGSSHCLLMCGGIGAAVGNIRTSRSNQIISSCAQPVDPRLTRILMFNLGRISSYGVIGLIVGLLGFMLAEVHQSMMFGLRVIAALLLILMGFYISKLGNWLTMIEQLGQPLWRRLQPLAGGFLASPSIAGSFVLGGVWGWLPCGLIYSTLAWAATSSSPLSSASLMLAFGIGTLPAMLAVSLSASWLTQLLSSRALRLLAGLLLIGYGVWTLIGAMHMVMH